MLYNKTSVYKVRESRVYCKSESIYKSRMPAKINRPVLAYLFTSC